MVCYFGRLATATISFKFFLFRKGCDVEAVDATLESELVAGSDDISEFELPQDGFAVDASNDELLC